MQLLPGAGAVPAERPRWKETGKPTGTVHGGTDGQSLKDRAWGRLAEVSARGDFQLDWARCVREDEGQRVEGNGHGGDGVDETVVKLDRGEHLVQASGVLLKRASDTVVGSLSFKMTKRTIGPILTLDAAEGRNSVTSRGGAAMT